MPDGEESTGERLDRNWGELLQELRVSQTGVQLLAGFLLTLPFQQRFADLDDVERAVYLATVVAACLATMLLITPVAMHRALFRQKAKDRLVDAANRLAQAGLGILGLALVGVVTLVFSVVLGRWASIAAATIAILALVTLWVVLPARERQRV